MSGKYESFKRAVEIVYKIHVTPDEYIALIQLMKDIDDSEDIGIVDTEDSKIKPQ